jgi:hypothetical protein
MTPNPPPATRQQGQRSIITIQSTTARPTPGATSAPPMVSVIRITYMRSPGAAPRLLTVRVSPSRPASNTERFWREHLARPASTRTKSLPPSTSRISKHRKSFWDKLKQSKHSAGQLLRRARDKLLRGRDTIRTAVRSVAKHWRTIAVVSGIAAGLGYVVTNSVMYTLQPQPAYLAQWSSNPTWLYADSPDQILGLHAPLWPRQVQQSQSSIRTFAG